MDFLGILIPPIVGAIIGYGTNCLAIRMLFRPHHPVYVFGIKVPFTPGLIPKEQARLAKKMASTVGGRLITPEILAKELLSSPLLLTGAQEIKKLARKNLPQLSEYIRQFEHPRLDELNKQGPELVKKLIQEHVGRLAGMFLDADKIFASLKEGLLEYISQEDNLEMIADKIEEGIDRFCNLSSQNPEQEYVEGEAPDSSETRIPDFTSALKKVAAHVARHIDVESIIENQINAIEPEEAEKLILAVIKRELHLVMALGGFLGFIIGWVPVLMNLFA